LSQYSRVTEIVTGLSLVLVEVGIESAMIIESPSRLKWIPTSKYPKQMYLGISPRSSQYIRLTEVVSGMTYSTS
jgi:hypothetical protein